MAGIDRFNRARFEAALPRHKITGAVLWVAAGFVDGERCYTIPVGKHGVSIWVRSTIGEDGQAAGCGEDSIRCYLMANGQGMGSKLSKWVTRVNGWEGRLTTTLRELWKMGQLIQPCKQCGVLMGIYKVKRDGEHKGQLFLKCRPCNRLLWVKVGEKGELTI